MKLTKSGESDITATNVTVDSTTRISSATFDITGAAVGAWTVSVDNPDSGYGAGSLTDGFTVIDHIPLASGTQAEYNSLAFPSDRHLVRDSAGTWYALFETGNDIYMTRSSDGVTWDAPTKIVGVSGGLIAASKSDGAMSVDIYRSGTAANDKIHLVWG